MKYTVLIFKNKPAHVGGNPPTPYLGFLFPFIFHLCCQSLAGTFSLIWNICRETAIKKPCNIHVRYFVRESFMFHSYQALSTSSLATDL